MNWNRWRLNAVALSSMLLLIGAARAQECLQTTILTPSPFMGNSGEIFKTADGALYEVVGSYEYLYSYYPKAALCPRAGKMVVAGKTIRITPLNVGAKAPSRGANHKGKEPAAPSSSSAPIMVVLRVRRCDYFVADGPSGYYLLEWYGGHDPEEQDGIYGELDTYGFKDILYSNGRDGRVYVDDYMVSKNRVLEKINDKRN